MKSGYLLLAQSAQIPPDSEGSQRPTDRPQIVQGGDAQEELPSGSPVIGDGTTQEEAGGAPADETHLLQESLSVPETGPTAPAVPLPAFLGGMLAALLVGAAAGRLLFRRKSRPPATHLPARGVTEYAALHETGARDEQQDAFCITGQGSSGVLAAVADGMGGLVNSGAVSQALTAALEDGFAPDPDTPPSRQLLLAFQQAQAKVEESLRGETAQSGSTLVACLVQKGGLSWLSVGDSRICLWRNGGLIQLNQEHNFHHDLTLLALQGDLELDEADRDPRRESLTSYIGRGFPRSVEWNPEPIQLLPGDQILLASDGVYRALSQNELANCLQECTAQKAVQSMHALIQEKALSNQDNYTGVVLRLG